MGVISSHYSLIIHDRNHTLYNPYFVQPKLSHRCCRDPPIAFNFTGTSSFTHEVLDEVKDEVNEKVRDKVETKSKAKSNTKSKIELKTKLKTKSERQSITNYISNVQRSNVQRSNVGTCSKGPAYIKTHRHRYTLNYKGGDSELKKLDDKFRDVFRK